MLEELARRAVEDRLSAYRPSKRQQEFHASGEAWNERLFMAGNQLGKTLGGGMEGTYHLTGLYPAWWQGLRYDKPVRMWAASISAEMTRDNPQRILLGEIENGFGTGTIPKKCIKKIRMSGRVQDGVNYVLVQHVTGGLSRLQFKSYDQGASKWQGPTLDLIWLDEEPPVKVYTEALTRTNKGQRGHRVMMTFTPLLGMSDTVNRFLSSDPKVRGPRTHITRMGIADADHYSEADKQAIIMSYPSHEREARANGTPILGSGRVFITARENLIIAPFELPAHWPVIAGIDIGWDHPAAAVKLAHDRDNDVVYLVREWRKREAGLAEHASAVRSFGTGIPVAWPQDALQHDKQSGHQYKVEMEREGLTMCGHYARYPDQVQGGTVKVGTNSVEAGVIDISQRCVQGRFKVFAGCEAFFEEYEMYHRKDGVLVKINDDVLSAVRYALMMLRFAVVPVDAWGAVGKTGFNVNADMDDSWIM